MSLKQRIEQVWEERATLSASEDEAVSTVWEVMTLLNQGLVRVCEPIDGKWIVNDWLKKAILLFFKLQNSSLIKTSVDEASGLGNFYDKVPLKFQNWQEEDFAQAKIRIVPGAIVRFSAYIGANAVLMPSFVNVGAFIGEGTLVDTWATVGSCAQVGKNCHISGGVGIGGVLEPIQSAPVIIEDDVFIGARSEIAEGVIVEQGAVLAMGVYIGSSTRVYDRSSGQIYYGRVPKHSVVVPGTLPSSDGLTNTYAAIIVKTVDAATKAKTSLNEILRDIGN
ncbi:MAG: 2,3,4,5-tetrahydropyridine-2,6-dicarboxylate N-succinyltransferase [Proteobacteria bacterium]|nr:2,3,4,5-tetrahydropyridine-2,6-dicarboxylate N-succinyltransferase [Pseudomonadota bacterium]